MIASLWLVFHDKKEKIWVEESNVAYTTFDWPPVTQTAEFPKTGDAFLLPDCLGDQHVELMFMDNDEIKRISVCALGYDGEE